MLRFVLFFYAQLMAVRYPSIDIALQSVKIWKKFYKNMCQQEVPKAELHFLSNSYAWRVNLYKHNFSLADEIFCFEG